MLAITTSIDSQLKQKSISHIPGSLSHAGFSDTSGSDDEQELVSSESALTQSSASTPILYMAGWLKSKLIEVLK